MPCHQRGISLTLLLLATTLFVPVHNNFAMSAVGLDGMCFDSSRLVGRTTVGPTFDFVCSTARRGGFRGRCHFVSPGATSGLFTRVISGPTAPTSDVPRLLGARHPGVIFVVLRDFSARLVRAFNKRPGMTIGVSGFTGRNVLFDGFCTGDFHASHNLTSVVDKCPKRPDADVVGCPRGASGLPSVPHDLGGTKCGLRCCCNKSTSFAGVHSCLMSSNVKGVVYSGSFPLSRHANG